MSSPAPWNDAREILEAANLGIPLSWPNEPFDPPPVGLWGVVECTGDALIPREMGQAAMWEEDGRLYVHVMAPQGSGSDASRDMAKRIANLFRGLGPRQVTYTRASIGAGEAADESGLWWPLTLTVDWQYQDLPA